MFWTFDTPIQIDSDFLDHHTNPFLREKSLKYIEPSRPSDMFIRFSCSFFLGLDNLPNEVQHLLQEITIKDQQCQGKYLFPKYEICVLYRWNDRNSEKYCKGPVEIY